MRAGDGLLALAYGRAYPEITATLAEAARLGLPVVLVSDEPDGPLAALAQVVLPACRGRAGQVALHAATLAVTEALVLGLAAAAPQAAVATLDELGRLRAAVAAVPG
jgi:DNA-binding MurR/RpiR family transcriptional regulator